jgi:hypothetical protein
VPLLNYLEGIGARRVTVELPAPRPGDVVMGPLQVVPARPTCPRAGPFAIRRICKRITPLGRVVTVEMPAFGHSDRSARSSRRRLKRQSLTFTDKKTVIPMSKSVPITARNVFIAEYGLAREVLATSNAMNPALVRG